MKKLGFIGGLDKTDIIIYVAKLLTTLGNKVLFIDASMLQKARYIVPTMTPARWYITQYEGIDVAVGFGSFDQLYDHIGVPVGQELDYDVILIDVDSVFGFQNFRIPECQENFFMTAFDLYSLKKGLEIINCYQAPIELTKVLFSKKMSRQDDAYLNYLAEHSKAKWKGEPIYFPFEEGDQSAMMENQRVSKIKYKNLTTTYKESIMILTAHIMPNVTESELRKALKRAEKGV